MELSTEICTGLKRLANNSLISDENMEKLLSQISKYMEDPFSIHHSVEIPSSTPKIDILKESYAALIVFLIEGMRRNIDENELKQSLMEFRIDEERMEKIIQVLATYKDGIRDSLRRFNSDPPCLLGATWKMNYCVKSSFSDLEGKSLYFIEFVTSDNDKDTKDVKKISFVCTVQQLQTLVATLKAAVRQLESIANISK